jgi:hypothetical protein
MKFWELVSIFGSDPAALASVLREPQWLTYLEWFRTFDQHVKLADRNVLDAEVPAELAERAMLLCTYAFCVRGGYLRLSVDHAPHALSAIDTYRRYGGDAIEEVLEKGSFQLASH